MVPIRTPALSWIICHLPHMGGVGRLAGKCRTAGGPLMTLFIACILIHQFGMAWWWYPIAAAIWAVRVGLHMWWSRDESRIPLKTER